MSSDRARPGYRTWYHRVRSRALRRLEAAHKDEFRQLLAAEQTADPYPR